MTESVLTRGSSVHRAGSQLARAQSPPPVAYSPAQGDFVQVVTDGLPIQNFINFVENTFERATLIEQHLVSGVWCV